MGELGLSRTIRKGAGSTATERPYSQKTEIKRKRWALTRVAIIASKNFVTAQKEKKKEKKRGLAKVVGVITGVSGWWGRADEGAVRVEWDAEEPRDHQPEPG